MAEYVQHITLCDRCRAGEQGESLPFHPYVTLVDENTKQRNAVKLLFNGVFRGGFDLAMLFGWEERDYGHICPLCVSAEKEENDFNNEEGTISGALREDQLPGGSHD